MGGGEGGGGGEGEGGVGEGGGECFFCEIPGNESNILMQKSFNDPPYTSQDFIKKENKLVSPICMYFGTLLYSIVFIAGSHLFLLWIRFLSKSVEPADD